MPTLPSSHHQHSQSSSQSSLSASQNTAHLQTTNSSSFYRHYNDSQHRPATEHVMPIYSATYSGVHVYEMEVNTVAVMRRQNDNWLNATQILKVAGVDKGRRTKILEKEIQTGEHEKVQGGYGKYQGTWIPFERGLEVCRQYEVEELLRRLLTHNVGPDGGPVLDVETPTKEQAMAAQRKRMYNASLETRSNGMSGTFFKNISPTASHAISAISRARIDSPGPRNRNGLARAASFNRQPSMHDVDETPNGSQQSRPSDIGQQQDTEMAIQNRPRLATADESDPPRKRQRTVATPVDTFACASQPGEMFASSFAGSPTEPNESFIYSQAGVNVHSPRHDECVPLRPLPYEMSQDTENKRSLLMSLFMDSNTSGQSTLDILHSLSPIELDLPIDTQCHTALHWAATLSRMKLLRALIAAGASPFRVNASGETPLMRACTVTNSMDLNSFSELLDVLGSTIDVRDDKGRTVLHHIAVTSAVKGRNMASRYYLESLLEWVVRQGSVSSIQNSAAVSSQNGLSSTPAKMGIGHFISEIVNSRDSSGDTALNIAARIGSRSIISQLLEIGADPNIANRAGLRPLDFGIGADGSGGPGSAQLSCGGKDGLSSTSARHSYKENKENVLQSITHFLQETGSEFERELKSKQQSVESLHDSLRTASSQLGEARRLHGNMKQKLRAQQLARQRMANFARAREEEEYRMTQVMQSHRHAEPSDCGRWEAQLESFKSHGDSSQLLLHASTLPQAPILRARLLAIRQRRVETERAVSRLKCSSRDMEFKYRRLVSLCTRQAESEIDVLLDGLTRAVESEKQELDIGRVRRFLGDMH